MSGNDGGVRIEVLDALRGFALFGILVTHIPDFSGYTFMTSAQQTSLDHFGVDQSLLSVLAIFIRNKFLSLFSLLFGISFSLQIDSAVNKGRLFGIQYVRRLALLAVIGIVHALLWYGDILKEYALIGLLLLAVSRLNVSALGALTAAAFAVRLAWPFVMATAFESARAAPEAASAASDFSNFAQSFASADFARVFSANLELLHLKLLQSVYEGRLVHILAMFLLGALIGRLQFHRQLPRRRSLLLLVLCAGGAGLTASFVQARFNVSPHQFPPTPAWSERELLAAIAMTLLSIAYAAGFALAWQTPLQRILRGLAPIGRTALSSYISQTLIGIGLFYGVAGGLHGRLGLANGLAVAAAIIAAQSALSAIWLRYFRYGPLEWVWRIATYAKPVKLRRNRRD